MRRSIAMPGFCLTAMVTIACFVCSAPAGGQARQRSSATAGSQIAELQEQIRTAEAAHASPQRLATLWIVLADVYEDQDHDDLESAEDGFARAIRLLHTTGAQNQDLYANALDGIATIYSATGRANAAERCLRQAVELEHAAGNSTAETGMRRDLAVAFIAEKKYSKATKVVSDALHLLDAQADPNVNDEITFYLTRSRAICGMRRCREALQDIERAEALASRKAVAESDPAEIIVIAGLRGMEQFRSGAVQQGDQTIQQALHQLDSRADIPAPFQVQLRLLLLNEYSQLLGSAHRKEEKKKVEAEIAQVKAQLPRCSGCTVSAASLGLIL